MNRPFVTQRIPDIPVRIKGKLYKQDIEYYSFKKGDLVLDAMDCSYGIIEQIIGCDGGWTDMPKAAVRDGNVVELGVGFYRLVKLIPMNRLQRFLWAIKQLR